MKVLKGISLFLVYPLTMLLLGFWCGMLTERFFYPGKESGQTVQQSRQIEYTTEVDLEDDIENIVVVNNGGESLCADTEYMVEEVDVLRGTSVETMRILPSQYIGMTREQFLATMENYQSAPPLMELERGFESLEVLSFSRERVSVRMNYRYVQPGQGFYLAVRDHEVIVYLDDKETIYIDDTGIMLDTLPDDMQINIIGMHYVEGEGDLYNFLETYSS